MALSLQQVQKQTQKLIMTPQMQQSIQLLQMTTLELEQLATQEMMANPFLELRDDEEELDTENSAAAADLSETPAEAATSSAAQADAANPADPPAAVEASGLSDTLAPGEAPSADDADALEADPAATTEDGLLEAPDKSLPDDDVFSYDATSEKPDDVPSEEPATFDAVDMDWDDYYSDSENEVYHSREDEEERDFTQYTATREGLYDHLLRQLHLSRLQGEAFHIGEFLIGNLNDDGLFDCSVPALLALLDVPVELLNKDADPKELRRAVARVLNKPPEELALLETRQLYFYGMAALLGVNPADLTGQTRAEIEKTLLARRLQVGEAELDGIDPRRRFLLVVARRLGVSPDAVEDALDVIQEFEPTGIGARDLAETLRLQAEAKNIRNPLLYRVLAEALGLLQQKKFREVAQKLGCREEEIAEIFHIVSLLEPKPGRSISKESAHYITPDVYVKKVDGKYLYYLNEGDTGRLRISAKYRRLLQNARFNGKDREYALEKLRSATWLIKNIEKRKSTILRVTEAIMNFQMEFLEKGIESLKPLTLREIADVVGMHESTIARVTTGKYVETPRGTFELKFFFSSGLETDEGDGASSRAIKEMIAQMIGNEDGHRPLSDQKIAMRLKEKGITIARRTVAKYREQMKILPAKLRRKTD